MMATLLPVQYTMTAWQTGTWNKTITWLSGGPGSQAVDLTGYTGTMTLTESGATTPFLTITPTLGGSDGTITLSIPAETMATIAAGTYLYQLTLTDPQGNVDPLLWGNFVVKAPFISSVS